MQIYEVGGIVRDDLLRKMGYSIESSDRDYVVVGATPEEMIRRGFKPVGEDFPVFLHPETHEEYALARTERKTAKGYHGFTFYAAPDVTLQDDLKRRDLTINAMARNEKGMLIDPYGGKADLKHKVFRHVSDAFIEDPVRILRLARFAARFTDFTVASETMALVSAMVKNGEADALVPERVFAEIAKGLMEKKPSRMLVLLTECGYWEKEESDVPLSTHVLDALDEAAAHHLPLASRVAILLSDAHDTTPLRRLRAPSDAVELTALLLKNRALANKAFDVSSLYTLLHTSDLLRRPERFDAFLTVVSLLDNISKETFEPFKKAFLSIDAGLIAKNAQGDIAIAIESARKNALFEVLQTK